MPCFDIVYYNVKYGAISKSVVVLLWCGNQWVLFMGNQRVTLNSLFTPSFRSACVNAYLRDNIIRRVYAHLLLVLVTLPFIYTLRSDKATYPALSQTVGKDKRIQWLTLYLADLYNIYIMEYLYNGKFTSSNACSVLNFWIRSMLPKIYFKSFISLLHINKFSVFWKHLQNWNSIMSLYYYWDIFLIFNNWLILKSTILLLFLCKLNMK